MVKVRPWERAEDPHALAGDVVQQGEEGGQKEIVNAHCTETLNSIIAMYNLKGPHQMFFDYGLIVWIM
jgi:hypothetical protein